MKIRVLLSINFILFLSVNIVYGSTLKVLDIPSSKMKKKIKVSLILPDLYATTKQRFPVLYLLHGAGDNHKKWAKETSIQDLADQYNLIIICPDANKTSWYFDSPIVKESQYETFIAIDLIDYIDKHYRTLATSSFRAISGNSMGGHGAMFLAIRHRDIFGVVGCLSGGVDIRPFANKWRIKRFIGSIKKYPERWEQLSVINLAKTLKKGELKIYMDCGMNDFFSQVNHNLHQQLLKAHINHLYVQRAGGHNWTYWRTAIKYEMIFVSEAFKEASMQAQKKIKYNNAMIPVPQLESDGYDWYKRERDIKKIIEKNNPQIAMIGDSIIHYWAGEPKARLARGVEAWNKFFAKQNIVNMGFGWDRIQNVLWRIQHGEIDKLRAKIVVLNIGTNNLTKTSHAKNNTPKEIQQGIEEVCQQILNHNTNTKIILMGIFPRGKKYKQGASKKITKINRLLQTIANNKNIYLLDIGSQFLLPNGNINQKLMDDFIHPTNKGYEIWGDALQKKIEQITNP